MTTSSAIADQKFVLEHVVRIDELANSERFAAASQDVVEAVLEGAASFAAGSWGPLLRRGDEVGARWSDAGVTMPDGFREAYRDYVDGGWGTIGGPPEYGGQGLPFVLATAVLETLGIANLGFALCPTLTAGAVEAIVHHGSPRQRDLYLPELVSGRWTGTMNLTEPQAGSDVGALRSRATPRADGSWNIEGTKIFISYGDHDLAENIVHLVLARTPNSPPGSRGISLFLVPKFRLDDLGRPAEPNNIRAISIEHKLGLHASPTCILSFGDQGECVGELVGEENGGMRAMFTMMNSARLNVGLQGVQVAEAATRAAVAYSRQRAQSARAGAPDRTPVAIIRHPDVRRMLLRMKSQTQAARALVYYAAAQLDLAAIGRKGASDRLELLTPLAKAHATDIGCEVASIGIQVHGGMGYIEETGAAQFYRDARIMPIYEGTNGIQAADLVSRKLGLDGGQTFRDLLGEMGEDAEHPELRELIQVCAGLGTDLASRTADDRLAASYPFLTMLSVATCGWLVERSDRAARPNDGATDFLAAKRATAAYYLDHIVPEALGLRSAAASGADLFYSIDDDAFAA